MRLSDESLREILADLDNETSTEPAWAIESIRELISLREVAKAAREVNEKFRDSDRRPDVFDDMTPSGRDRVVALNRLEVVLAAVPK